MALPYITANQLLQLKNELENDLNNVNAFDAEFCIIKATEDEGENSIEVISGNFEDCKNKILSKHSLNFGVVIKSEEETVTYSMPLITSCSFNDFDDGFTVTITEDSEELSFVFNESGAYFPS